MEKINTGAARAEYIEVETNVHLHITDAGEGSPKLLSDFATMFSATETSLNEGIGTWLNGIGLSASSHAMAQCLLPYAILT
jgi:hypothetical protein